MNVFKVYCVLACNVFFCAVVCIFFGFDWLFEGREQDERFNVIAGPSTTYRSAAGRRTSDRDWQSTTLLVRQRAKCSIAAVLSSTATTTTTKTTLTHAASCPCSRVSAEKQVVRISTRIRTGARRASRRRASATDLSTRW